MGVGVPAHEYSGSPSLQDLAGLHSLLGGQQGGPRDLRQPLEREQRGEESLQVAGLQTSAFFILLPPLPLAR